MSRTRKPSLRKPQSHNAYLHETPSETHLEIISPYLNNDHKALAALSVSCFYLNSLYQPPLNKNRLQQFLQAVVDDKIEKVKQMLKRYPALLLEEPEENLVIESQYTWQKYYAENALAIASKRRQLEMIQTLLPYFDEVLDKVPDKEPIMKIKTDALAKWPSYEKDEEEDKDEYDDEYEFKDPYEFIFHVPADYLNYFLPLFDVIERETFPHGKQIGDKLSDETEEALREFRRKMLPQSPVRLDDCLPIELLLYMACQIYSIEGNRLDIGDNNYIDCEKRSIYCRYVIGFLQSLLPPKSAEEWCKGLLKGEYYDRDPLFLRARAIRGELLLLTGGHDFYRVDNSLEKGLGFEYCCGDSGNRVDYKIMDLLDNVRMGRPLANHILTKNSHMIISLMKGTKALDEHSEEELDTEYKLSTTSIVKTVLLEKKKLDDKSKTSRDQLSETLRTIEAQLGSQREKEEEKILKSYIGYKRHALNTLLGEKKKLDEEDNEEISDQLFEELQRKEALEWIAQMQEEEELNKEELSEEELNEEEQNKNNSDEEERNTFRKI